MEYLINNIDLRSFIYLPQNFDETLIEQEVAWSQNIFPYFPEDVVLELKNSTEESYQEISVLINKAAARYAFIFSIPLIKVQIDNFGILEFNEDKAKQASWWNVRDLGLSHLKAADKYLSDAITKASAIPELKASVPILNTANSIVTTPEELNAVFSINYSPAVYASLLPYLNEAVELYLNLKLKPCTLPDLLANSFLKPIVKRAIAFYAFSYASALNHLTFLRNAVVLQYEELPWQKSVVLNESEKQAAGARFMAIADQSVEAILNYIELHKADFDCYKEEQSVNREVIKKKSGLYL